MLGLSRNGLGAASDVRNQEFYPRAQARLSELYEVLSPEEKNLVHSYANEIDRSLGERLLEVCGWFIPDEASFSEIEQRIRLAHIVAETQALADAAVEEGFSGLRKVVGLLRRVKTPGVSFEVEGDESKGRFTFRALLPSEIMTTQAQ